MRLLSPFPEASYPSLFGWIRHEVVARMLDDYAPTEIGTFVEMMRSGGGGYRSWAVEHAGEIGGFVSWQPTNPRSGLCWFIFRPKFLFAARWALDEATQELFSGGEVERVSFLPFADQGWAIRLLKDLGAVREGTLRDSTMRGGKPANQAVFAILKSEVESYAKAKVSAGDAVLCAVGADGQHSAAGGGPGADGRKRTGELAGQSQEGANLRE